MREFRISILVSVACLAGAFYWGEVTAMGGMTAIWIAAVLGVLEVSLSFDNAVVNAAVLKRMNAFWRKMFLTVGILIAVFGMRLIFPVLIVAAATQRGFGDVMTLALQNPEEYSRVLTDNYPSIAAFGGMFLMLVFLNFLYDNERELHWLGWPEARLAAWGQLDNIAVITALSALLATRWLLPPEISDAVLPAGLAGVILYMMVATIDHFFSAEGSAVNSGVGAFLYLEVLDASFSFDGVIGAFAITRDIVIIMLGLAIGAMFVRSLTVFLVHRGTLDDYVFLEHGAHYAIGVLAVIMLAGTVVHVPEVVTGLIGVGFILAALYSSIRHRSQQAGSDSASP